MALLPSPDDGDDDQQDSSVRDQGPVAAFTGEPWEYTGLPEMDLNELATGIEGPDADVDSASVVPQFDIGPEQTEEEVETSQEKREEVEEMAAEKAEKEGFLTRLGEFSDRSALAIESTLDPEEGFSVQESVQEGLKWSEYMSTAASSGIGEAPTPDEYDFKSDEEIAEEIQRDWMGTREQIHEATLEAGEGTPFEAGKDTYASRFGDALGSFTGSVFDVFVTEPVKGATTTLTGIDPTGGYEPGVLTEPTEGEVTGGTEEVPLQWWEPVFEILAFGGPAVLGAGGAKLSARLAGRGDEVGELIGPGTKAVEQAQGMSAIDEIIPVSRRYDELVGAADEPVESFRLPEVNRNILPSDDALRGTDTAVDEAGAGSLGLDELSETIRGTDEPSDLGLSAGDEGASPLDEVSESFGSQFDETLQIGDETVTGGDEAFQAGEEGGGVLDEMAESVSRRQDQFDEWLSGSDEGLGGMDETVGGADETMAGFDEALRASDESAGMFDETVIGSDEAARTAGATDEAARTADTGFLRSTAGRVVPGRFGTALAALGVGGAAAYALSRDDIPRTSQNGAWRHERETVFRRNGRTGVAVAIYRRDERVGIAVIVGKEPLRVLTADAGTRRAGIGLSALRNGREGAHLEPEFTTVSQARNVFNQWAAEGGDDTTEAAEWDGNIDAPNTVGQTEAFNVEATVENQSQEQRSGRFVVGISTGGNRPDELARKRARVPGRGSTDLTFDVGTTTSRLKPGDYTLSLFAAGDGRIDSTGVTVEGGEGDGDGEDTSGWAQPEIVRELGDGWYLVEQRHRTEDKVRYIGAGKREDGTRIYLYPGGKVRTSPHYFDTPDAVAQAYAAWRERAQSGDTSSDEEPSTTGGRPGGSGMHRDTKKKDQGVVSGTLSGLADLIGGPGGIGVVGLIVIAVAVYYFTDGEPIKWLQEQYNDIVQEVS